ncbi:penicillin-binding protein 2 [Paraconexibacter sp.]|uniref:penicillin-binding protein 2 n=1 Tax=Paraconexibacter sp. TaxID=2949640 RepID=UPI0035690974
MIDPVSDRRPPITPQLALRVAFIGGLAFVLFGIVFFRLWYLQVLDGDRYLAQAQSNRVRTERIQAPRGTIVDRNGNVLVQNRQATLVQLDPEQIPQEEKTAALEWGQRVTARLKKPKGQRGRYGVPIPEVATPELEERFKRLARVLEMSVDEIQRRTVQQIAQVPYARVTLKTDVPDKMRDYIEERQEQFPGVEVGQKYLREYPQRELAAQIVGTVGEVSPKQLEDRKRYRGVSQGAIVGQEGLEYQYDEFLRGRDGATRIVVNAQGENRGQGRTREPRVGHTVKLTLDLELQKAAQEALQRGMMAARGNGNRGDAGAFVAMDPTNGEILALGSAPSFDPNVLSRPISQERYEALFSEEAGAPRFNRAIASQYATGSTFKTVTAYAGLAAGLVTPETRIADAGCIKVGLAKQEFCNAGKTANGSVDLREAMKVSSDIYFYRLGQNLNPLKGEILQSWAKRFGFGKTTGIDLPGEAGGNVPDRDWRARVGKAEADCRKRRKIPLTARAGCGISDMRPWTFGDNMNLSVGQGDLQATPLQLALSYAILANGGKVVEPHVGKLVEDDRGRELQSLRRGAPKRVKLDAGYREAIMDGLHQAASAPGGTSTTTFEGWPHDRYPVYGKTGTAEVINAEGYFEQSWYVAYVPSPTKPIVVAVTVEKGGFGAEAAAPAVRQILSQHFFNKPGVFKVGTSRTN